MDGGLLKELEEDTRKRISEIKIIISKLDPIEDEDEVEKYKDLIETERGIIENLKDLEEKEQKGNFKKLYKEKEKNYGKKSKNRNSH